MPTYAVTSIANISQLPPTLSFHGDDILEKQNHGTGTNEYVFGSQILSYVQGHLTLGGIALSMSGNTAGAAALISSGTGILAGGSNITLSQAGQTISIVAASAAAGTQTFGMSNLGNTSGTTGVATGSGIQGVLIGGNNITLSQSLNGASASITISAANQTVESQSFGMSNLGNTSGTTGIASGGQVRFVLAGGNNVTLSQSINGASGTITISVAATAAAGQNTLGMSNLGNTSGTTGVISGSALQLVFAGGNNVTLSQSINGSSATITVSAFTESQTIGMSNIGNTSGTTGVVSGSNIRFVFAGGNNVTLSQSINGVSGTITISAAATVGAGAVTLGMSNLGNTSGTTGVVSGSLVQYLFAGGNNITLSQSINGSSASLTISAFNQSVQPIGTGTFGMSNLGNTSGTTGVATGTSPLLVLAGGNNVTLSQSLNGASATITISAFNQSVQTQSLGSDTLGMSNVGNTSGTTGVVSGSNVELILAGGNNVTLSQSINGSTATITISAFNQSVQTQSLGSDTIGMSNIGNTSGTTGVVSGSNIQFVFAGGNNVTLSQSINGVSGTITISAAATAAAGSNTLGISNLGNTSGTSGVISGSALQFLLAGGANVTLSQSTNGVSATVTISAGAGAAAPTVQLFQNMAGGSQAALVTSPVSFDTLVMYPLLPNLQVFPGNMTVGTWFHLISISGSTATMSSAQTSSFFLGLYTFNASTWSLLNSVSTSWGSNAGNANLSTQQAGLRWISIHSSLWSASPTLSQGLYWFATLLRSAGVACQTVANFGQTLWPTTTVQSGTVGVSQVNATTVGAMPGYGRYSVSTSALPATIGSAELNKQVVVPAHMPAIQLNNLIASF